MKKGKYAKKKNNTVFRWIIVALILIAAGIAGIWIAAQDKDPGENLPSETMQIPESEQATTVPAETGDVQATEPGEPFQPINLGYGIQLEAVSSYTGTYMEDGSDKLVSDVMMIRVTNTGEDDVQLMNIEVSYSDMLCHFTVTNLPAGGKAILLELEQAAMPAGAPISAVASDVVLFSESMQVDFDTFAISGADGALNVKNISAEDISGDIYVYYKYKVQDIYYGGITFRARIEGGLAAGEIRQVMTSHYNPDNCQVIMIDVVQTNGT